MEHPADLLLVEDDALHVELIERAFEAAADFRVRVARSLVEANAALAQAAPDLIITDLRLPDGRGIDLVRAGDEDVPYAVVIMTSHGGETLAVEAMKAGALDYVVKSDTVFADMPRIAGRALREWRLIVERRRAELELAQRERELRHAQKMEAVGRLASGIAHDVNNVLMGIIGCADVALSKLAPGAEARRYVADVKKAALAGAATARGLLAFSRSDVAPGAVEIESSVAATRDMLRVLLGSDIALDVQLAAPGVHVRCGSGEIEQLLMNLAINARDAMPRGGVLTIRTQLVEQPAGSLAGTQPEHHAGPTVLLTVSDTGVGMDDATRVRAFEPFFTTKELGKGTGLGLSSVYGMVTRWGGRIELDSEPGRGTTFRVHLPTTSPPPVSRPEREAHAQNGGATILFVEDDELIRRSVRYYLETAGYHVLEAAGADEAQAVIHDEALTFQLLLTDVALPGASGPELAVTTGTARPGLPVAFVSGHAHQTLDGTRRLPEGALLLPKPFGEAELLAFVATALEQRPAVCESCVARQPAETTPPVPPVGCEATVTLLLVEDHWPSRLAARELLADCGFRVLDAATATEARTLFREHGETVDVLVTDMSLPDGMGSHLAIDLRTRRPNLCVLLLSGRERDDPEVRRVLSMPRTAFVLKPIEIDGVAATIRRLVELRE